MNFKRIKLSASNNEIDFKTCGTIFCKTYTDTIRIKSSYFVITPPHISEIRQNGNSHHTIHPSSNRLVVQKSTDIRKGMLSYQRTCNIDVKYISTYLSYIMPPLLEYLARPSPCNPNISSVKLTEEQPTVSNPVMPNATLNKYISMQCMIKEHTDTLRIDNSKTSKIPKLHILTTRHLTGSSAMIGGRSLHEGYEENNMFTYPTYYENRLKKYKSPVQIGFEKLRWLCNILWPPKHHTIITVGNETDSQTTYIDTQCILLQSIKNTWEDVSTYYVYYKQDINSKLVFNFRQNALSGFAIQDSPDVRQPNVITPYVRESNKTCNPMLNIGRNIFGRSTDTLLLLLYAVMKTTLEIQIHKTRHAIVKAKKTIQDLTHLPIQHKENHELIIRANEEAIHAPTNIIAIRHASFYNNTPYEQQQQHTKEKQDITYSNDDKVHVTDENICTGHVDMTRVSESTPEKTPRIWSIFNSSPGIFSSLKNILRPTCTLRSTKSSKNKIQHTRTKHTTVEKQTKHSAKRVRASKIAYEWTIFYPTYGDIKKKGGLSYLLHYKEIKKQVTEKPQNSHKYSVLKKTDSLPVPNHRATISGSRPLYTSNHYFVVHFSNSENELTAENQNCPVPRNVNGLDINKKTKDSILGGKSTTFFKTYQDINLNSLLRFQYYFKQ